MRFAFAFALACLAAGCRVAQPSGAGTQPASTEPQPAGAETQPPADSIVLERTRCYGTCPAYRLSLARSGAIRFRSLNPGDSARVAADMLPPGAFTRLEKQAAELGFDALPDRIAQSRLCGGFATDHPSAIVTLFRGARAKRVDDYLGCRPGPEALRSFEEAIDSTARSDRWVHEVGFP
ncbi:MAG: DUF6438 domain-containing protein [Longimicrobiaceae bacterium]